MNKNLRKILYSALFCALTAVATALIHIPTPTKGYVNAGDCFVILSAVILGPVWGVFAAGVGSMLADIALGYTIYAPGTLVIKACCALCAVLIWKLISSCGEKRILPAMISCGVVAEIVMVLGYYVYESIFICGWIVAATGIVANCMQGIFGIVSSTFVYLIMRRAKLLNMMKL